MAFLNLPGMQRRHRRGDAKFSSDPSSPGVRRLPTSCRSGGGWPGLVGAVGVLRPLQLHFESLHADLEAVHRLDGSLGAARVVEAHKACGGEGGGEGGGDRSHAVRWRSGGNSERMGNEEHLSVVEWCD